MALGFTVSQNSNEVEKMKLSDTNGKETKNTLRRSIYCVMVQSKKRKALHEPTVKIRSAVGLCE
jgi:hypothetical protein